MSGLGAYLQVEDVLLGLTIVSKQQLFDAVARHVQSVGGLSAEDVSSGLMRREQAASTALGLGVAVPHARVKGLARIRVLYVRPAVGMAFDAPDAHPVCDIVILLVPDPASQQHLDVLALVVSLFSDAAFRAALHERHHPAQIRALVNAWQLGAG